MYYYGDELISLKEKNEKFFRNLCDYLKVER